jgi:hypothetical protein
MSALAGVSVLYVLVVALALAISAAVFAERPPLLDAALVVCSLAALAVSSAATFRLFTGARGSETLTHVGYVAVAAFLLPATVGFLRDDRGRWASAGWSVAGLVLVVVLVRLVETAHD